MYILIASGWEAHVNEKKDESKFIARLQKTYRDCEKMK